MKTFVIAGAVLSGVVVCAVSAPAVACALQAQPVPPATSAQAPQPRVDTLRAAVEAALPLVQRSGEEWYESRSCSSCHHAALGLVAVSAARERGWAVDEDLAARLLSRFRRSGNDVNAEFVQGESTINAQIGQSYRMLALAACDVPPNPTTDAIVHFLLGRQQPDGRWASESHRPPLEDSEFTATALSARALRRYAMPGRAAEIGQRVQRAHDWFATAVPRNHEERVMRLFGLAWTDGTPDELAAAGAALRGEQREDGGWAQVPSLASDAFATGEALVALCEVGGVPTSDPCIRRGVDFLLRTQLPDGTWLVETRRRSEGLKHFETGFPHGVHQFISCAGTCWAIAALCAAADDERSPIWTRIASSPRPAPSADLAPGAGPASTADHALGAGSASAADPALGAGSASAADPALGAGSASAADPALDDGPATAADPALDDGLPPLIRAVLYEDLASVQALLDAGADPNVRGERGLTPLIGAAGDLAQTRLLLEHGAGASARSELDLTALLVAAATEGGLPVLQLLLPRTAGDPTRAADLDAALRLAAISGDVRKVDLLLAAGAHLDAKGAEGETALALAGWQGDAAMVRHLLGRGAAPDAELQGATPLVNAVIDGQDGVVVALLEAGADTEARDHGEPHDTLAGGDPMQSHLTPLLWAATSDHGTTLALQALLAKGADLAARDEHGATALRLAETNGYGLAAEILLAAGATE